MSDENSTPVLSVVVPTYNRRARLHRVLTALALQTTAEPFEVVVVSDGSTDGTDAYLQSDDTPIRVRSVAQDNAGPAAARNAGLEMAHGRIVLFLDDDVVPAPDLLEQHLAAHAANTDDIVVIGPMLTPGDSDLSPWVAWEQHQLYKQYEAMRLGEYDPTFRQFFTGNASVSRQRVIDAGQFDTRFRRAEDVELAFRLHDAGLRFVFAAEARGYHYAERSFDSWLSTPFDYGRNDATFMRSGQHWMTETMPREFSNRHLLVRSITRACVPRPRLARFTTEALRRLASSRVAAGPVRRQALSGIYNLAYYRGLADGLGSVEQFFDLIDRGELTTPAAAPTAAPAAPAPPRAAVPLAAFVLEQTLGHVTQSDNLRTLLGGETELDIAFLPVPFEVSGLAARLPGYGNWTVRAGVRARRLIRAQWKRSGIDVMFIHTQVPAVLTGRWMRRIPTVVSLDATPAQYDQLGEYYAHETSSPRIEAWKKRANMRCFQRAAHIVAWSDWARDSLIKEYSVARDAISVIAPGVHIERWQRPQDAAPANTSAGSSADAPVRILFVGGDLDRKGGRLLIEAAARLRADPSVARFELHLVTRAPVADPDVVVHSAMTPNSQELIALYHRSDVFCLPTLGDCLPMVLSEAGVAGMALLSTDVGAIPEIVRHEETGLLIPPGDLTALVAALRRLIDDGELRRRLGLAAQALVRRDFDARHNAARLVDILLGLTTSAVGRSRGPCPESPQGSVPGPGPDS